MPWGRADHRLMMLVEGGGRQVEHPSQTRFRRGWYSKIQQ